MLSKWSIKSATLGLVKRSLVNLDIVKIDLSKMTKTIFLMCVEMKCLLTNFSSQINHNIL